MCALENTGRWALVCGDVAIWTNRATATSS